MEISEMTEDDVKKVIRSLLTSTPNVLNIKTVQKDYKELMGTDVPYQKFGYNSLELFLKCIPDVCLVQGAGPWATVIPIVNEKVAHINNMVMKQKNNSRKPTGFRRPKHTHFQKTHPPSIQPIKNYSFSPHTSTTESSKSGSLIFYNSQMNPHQNNVPPPKPATTSKSVGNVKTQSEADTKPVGNTEINSGASQKLVEEVNNPQLMCQKPFDNSKAPTENSVSARSSSELKASVNHRLLNGSFAKRNQHLFNVTLPPKQRETVHHQDSPSTSTEINPIPDNAPVLDKEDEYFFTSKNLEHFKPYLNAPAKLPEVTEEVGVCVPKSVQNNLKTLISRFDEGIWCSQLPEEYRKTFRKELSYFNYGFTSLIEMCIALKNIFHYVRPGQDDFKLYDRNKPLPEGIERNFTMASYQLDHNDGTVNIGEPFPSLLWSDFAGRLPPDILPLGEEIPKQFLSKEAKVGDVFDVVVLEVYDPSKFWFYLGKSDKKAPLDLLMDDMQVFYKDENITQYSVPPPLVKEGLFCVQRTLGEYHRAKIVRIPSHTQEQVRLLYIDYGTVSLEPVKGLCFLHRQFAELPAQAIRCRLANVKPTHVGPWPSHARDYLRDVLNSCDTKLKVTFIDWDDEYVCGFLADVTDMDRVVYINELLVQKGHAVWEKEAQESPFTLPNYKCKVNRLHLFPSFLELEYGLAPNALEMNTLEEMLVPINFCIPQYFEPEEAAVDEDEAIEARENAFLETVKNHRKTLPYGCKESRAAMECPDFDFDVFNELSEDIVAFIEGLPPEKRAKYRNVGGTQEVVNQWHETEEVAIDEDTEEVVRQDLDLSENILKQLETHRFPEVSVLDERDELDLSDVETLSQTDIDEVERELSMLLNDDFVEQRRGVGDEPPVCIREDAACSNPFSPFNTADAAFDDARVSSDDDTESSGSRGAISRMQMLLSNIKGESKEDRTTDEVDECSDVDPFHAETPMEKARAEFVSSLNPNNPFRAYLEMDMGRGDDNLVAKSLSLTSQALTASARSVTLSANSEPFVPRAAANISTQTSKEDNTTANATQAGSIQPFTPQALPYAYAHWSEFANFQPRVRPPPGFDRVRPHPPDPRMYNSGYNMQYFANMNFAFGLMNQAAQFHRYPDFYDRYNSGSGPPW